jgi:hydroxymethylglutaryl-CoA reductase (NADPH)
MTSEYQRVRRLVSGLRQSGDADTWQRRLSPDHSPPPPSIRHAKQITEPHLQDRWKILRDQTAVSQRDQQLLCAPGRTSELSCYEGNIENFVGMVQLPIGVAGPLRIRGTHARGDYYVPLATTEAALVASYHRGALLLTKAGGCTSVLLSEGLERSPGFAFAKLSDAGRFIVWATDNFEQFKCVSEATSQHLQLCDMYVQVEGNHVYLSFEYTTGDAAGQNMVTIGTDAICTYINEQSPVRPLYFLVEANFSGDKKASALSFTNVRGKKVSAEVIVPGSLVEKMLHATAECMCRTWRMSAIGGVMSGTMGIQGHYANALAALYIATGQDAACIAESAVGVTRMELTDDSSLYAAVTLPNLIVGTVGGGTSLPTQQACMRIANLQGVGSAQQLAEVCAAICLAGELSITGAIAAQEFTRAHRRLARGDRGGHSSRVRPVLTSAEGVRPHEP